AIVDIAILKVNRFDIAFVAQHYTHYISLVAASICFVLAAAYLLIPPVQGAIGKRMIDFFPPSADLDRLSYRLITFGFPFLTLGIVSGAIWANYAWGRPWSWDPKETWSLITWFIYAVYLHARITAGWKGRRAAIINILGFVSVVFTYVGVNFILSGLHSYARALIGIRTISG
ncbi:MAG: cytochrome c biogenesis protein CcsA, partial [bacterium]